MNRGPCSGHGFGCGCATSETAGKNDGCTGHIFRNPGMTFHGAWCERCGLSFLEWGRRMDAEIAEIADQRYTD